MRRTFILETCLKLGGQGFVDRIRASGKEVAPGCFDVEGESCAILYAEYQRHQEEAKKPKAGAIRHIAHGATGLAKAAVNATKQAIKPTPEFQAMVKERRAICDDCKSKQGPTCRECGCVLSAKIRVPSESCPLDPPKWEAKSL